MDLHDLLPAGNYVVRSMPTGELYLEAIENFEVNHKLYGKIALQTKKVLHTFNDRGSSTGLMLSGEKGSGKTLLAKNICVEGAKAGVPTIVINAPWRGDSFNTLIQHIRQPCIVLFDEFEKVYDAPKQQEILTLLDGVFPSKKMFIITCNNKWGVDIHMRNRPGRIYYMLEFKGLEDAFIQEYCQDNLTNEKYTDSICKIASVFDSFNFDMLKALVEEMNRFDESPQEAISMLNAKPEFSNACQYNMALSIDGKKVDEASLNEATWLGNPMFGALNVGYYVQVEGKDEDDDSQFRILPFGPGDIEKIDAREGKFIYRKGSAVLSLTRVKQASYSYFDSF